MIHDPLSPMSAYFTTRLLPPPSAIEIDALNSLRWIALSGDARLTHHKQRMPARASLSSNELFDGASGVIMFAIRKISPLRDYVYRR